MENQLTYGKHSTGRCEEEFACMFDSAMSEYTGNHRLTPVYQLGSLKELVYYAHHLRGFVRAEKPFERI